MNVIFRSFRWLELFLILFTLLSSGCIKITGALTGSIDGVQFQTQRYSVYVNKQVKISSSDLKGKGSFKFAIEQGIGTIDSETGVFQAPPVVGLAVVSVSDSEGILAYNSIEVVDDLRVKVSDFSMVVNTSYLLQVSGGKYPYTFSVGSGDIQVDALGLITAGVREGPASLKVSDSAGNTVTVTVNVVSNLSIVPGQFSVTRLGSKDFTTSGGVGLSTFALASGTGTVQNAPARFTASSSTGTVVVSATDEMKNVGYSFGQVFGSLQISPHMMKIEKGTGFSSFQALGGVPPFTYAINGTGTINPTTGEYTAPLTSGVTDRVTVTDALGNTSEAVITVTDATRFFAKNAIVHVGEVLDFTSLIFGGAPNYTLSVAVGEGTVSSLQYTAPASTGNYAVTVTDNNGLTTQSLILVYPAFSIFPTQLNISVDSQDFFTVQGGVPPYSFQILSGLGSIDPVTGVYSSGSQTGTAVVKVTDAQNNSSQANVSISSRLALGSNMQKVAGGGIATLIASGGVPPYVFSIESGSGTLSSVNTTTSSLETSLVPGVIQVKVSDALGNSASNYIQVLSKLSSVPTVLNIKTDQQFYFGAQGGLAPYQFKIQSGTGSISSEGLYKAGSLPGTDVMRITDSLGNTADATIVIYKNLQVLPTSKVILIGGTVQMSAVGGVAPYSYSITSGNGTINTSGLFTASSTAGSVVIHVTDSEGNFSDSVITVNPALEIIPSTVSLKNNKSYNFAAAGGVTPYKFSVTSGNGGTINAATGDYTAPNNAGNYQVQVKDNDGNTAFATVSVSNSGNGNGNTPASGPADHLVYLAGNTQTGTVMTVLPTSLQVKVVDSSGNPVANTGLKVTVTAGNGNPGYATITTDSAGVASTPYFLGNLATTETIRIESSGAAFPGSPAFINFTETTTPGVPSVSASTIVASPNAAIPADGSTVSNITVTVKDMYSNVIPNATVTLNSTGTGNTLSLNSTTTNASGQITATLKSTVPENKTVSFIAPTQLTTLNTIIGFGASVTPDATKSTITGTSNVVADGVATATITINLKSSSDQPAAGIVPTFSATDTNGVNTYGACSISDSSGNSTCTLSSTKAETKILSIVSPVSKTGASIIFVNGATNKIVFTQQPVSALINTAMSPQPIVEVQDAYGNRVTTGADATGAISLSLISGSGTLAGTTTMSAVAGVADFSGKNLAINRAGAKTIKATLTSYSVNSSSFTITSVPTQLAWSGSTSIVRGSCASLTLSSYDANNDLANVSADLNVSLGGAGSGGFYSDNACSTPIASTTIAQNTNNKTIYYKNNNSGSYSLTADAASFAQAVDAITVLAGSPTKLVWSGPGFVGVGTCSSAFTITTQDDSNQVANIASSATVSLAGQANGLFYSDAGCSTSVNQVTIAAGNNSVNLYYKNGMNETVTLTANATGLTQGSYAVQSRNSVLYLSGTGGSTLDGVAITSCGGTGTCNSTNPYTISTSAHYDSIVMANGAYITGSSWTSGVPAVGNGKLLLQVTNDFSICSNCVVQMDGKGYKGSGPGYGGTYVGGSHGGVAGNYPGYGVGPAAFDNTLDPSDLGGSGNGTGGPGGGLLNITVGGTLTLNGAIQANGMLTSAWMGGAGGSIKITMGTLSGFGGSVKVNGASAYNGAGAGGRMALFYNTDSYSGGIANLTKEAFGGAGSSGVTSNAAAGTIFYKHVNVDSVGHLIIKNNNYSIGNLGVYLPTTELTADASGLSFDSVTVAGNSILEVKSGNTFNLLTAGTLNFPLYLNGGTLGNIPNNDLTVSATGILWLPGTGTKTFNNLTVDGTIYQWNYNTTSLTYKVSLYILNNLTINSSGSIDVSGHGYSGGGNGYGGANSGGGHGGIGGNYPGSTAGSAFDSTMNPSDLGGSGNGSGGPGGGLLEITVGNTLTLNGAIQANGMLYSAWMGGAGGSIKISTDTLAGTQGSIKVNGASAYNGAGAGGRMALFYNNDSYSGGIVNLTKEAFGGAGSSGVPSNGAAGTIFYKHVNVDSVGHLIIKNNNYSIGNLGVYLPTTELTSDVSGVNLDSFTVGGNSILEVKSGTLNLPTAGTLNFPLYLNGGTLGNIPNNDLTITSAGILWLPGTGTQTFNNLTVDGKIYQWNYNGTTLAYKLIFNILNNLTVSSSGSIDVSGHGYIGGGPGYGGTYTGGSHGGVGGNYPGYAAAAASFDNIINPSDLGGSGNGTGGPGGGLLNITVGGTLTLNGAIQANGMLTSAWMGGAGGSIKITTNTLAGFGGGIKVNGASAYNGAGAGGRMALFYNNDNYTGGVASLIKEASGGAGSAGASSNGAAGTIYVAPLLNINLTSGTLPAMMNFSRASSGSYYNSFGVLSFAANNQPRFDFNPNDYSSLGLLIEPQRSNEIIFSEDITQAYWSKQDVTLSASSVAPDGVTAPYKLSETSATSYHSLSFAPNFTVSQNYVLSFYAKAVERSWLAVNTVDLAGVSADSYVNLSTGASGTVQHSSVSVQAINNGWYRIYVKFNAGIGGGPGLISIGSASANDSKSYAGTPGSGMYLWGFQLEAGNYGTSYISTAGVANTRSADVVSATDLSWLVSGTNSLGTFLLDVQVPFLDYSMPFLQLDNGSSASSHRIGLHNSSYTTQYILKESSTTYMNLSNGSWANGDRKKICATFKSGAGQLSTGGVAASKGTPTSVPYTGLSTLRLGADNVNTSFSGHILSVKYATENYTDQTCQQISQ
ncbi:MAG: phage head spike fiber domain-containing protein [Mucilaginibacter sp.]